MDSSLHAAKLDFAGTLSRIFPVSVARPLLTVVLPAFNEEKTLRSSVLAVVRSTVSLGIAAEIAIVNDGSIDRTASVAEALSMEHGNVRTLHHAMNRGLGASLRTGFSAARTEFVAWFPADDDFDPEAMAQLLSHMGTADVILHHTSNPEVRRWSRRMLSAAYTRILNLGLGLHLRYYNGAAIYRTELVRKIPQGPDDFLGMAHLVVGAVRSGASLAEIGVPLRVGRRASTSKALSPQNIAGVVTGLRSLRRLAPRGWEGQDARVSLPEAYRVELAKAVVQLEHVWPGRVSSPDRRLLIAEVPSGGRLLWELDLGGVIQGAWHEGLRPEELAKLADFFCALAVGWPVRELADHGVLRLEYELRQRADRPLVAGVILPETVSPYFAELQSSVRQAAKNAGVETLARNVFEPEVSERWRSWTKEERIRRVQALANEVLSRQRDGSTIRAQVFDVSDDVVVLMDVEGDGSESRKAEFLRALEARMKEELDRRAEVYLPTREDRFGRQKENPLTQLGRGPTTQGEVQS